MRALMFSLALVPLAAHFPAQAQTAPLNDTGVTQCISGGALVACTDATTGDTAAEPRQDARFGRDAAAGKSQLSKTGGGAAGFDFTALNASGNPTAPGGHVCVRDNVTGLIWSTETISNVTLSAATTAAATYNRCGYNSNWRVPTRRELLSIVHYGTDSPAVDTNYFPNTISSWYWTSEVYAPIPAYVRLVGFHNGYSGGDYPTASYYVRLVRSGP